MITFRFPLHVSFLVMSTLLCVSAMVCSSQVLAQETGTGDQSPAAAEQQRFPFENYDFYRVEEADDGTDELVPVERQSLGLYTPEEHFQQAVGLGSAAWSVLAGDYWTAWGQMSDAGTWLSAFSATLGSQGSGLVMVKKQDDASDDSSALDEVIVIISGYGPFDQDGDGAPDGNNSTGVADVIYEKLRDAGITTEQVIIDVIWGEPDKKVDEVVTDTKTNHPDKKVIWIGLGVGGKFKLETVGQNEQGQFPDADTPPTTPPPGSQNDPNGPDSSDAGYDSETLVCVLHSHGIDIPVSTDAGQYLCDALTYKLHCMDNDGEIDCGIFIHIPPVTDGDINDKFADGLLDVIRIFAEELNEESDDDSGDGSTGGNSIGNGQ